MCSSTPVVERELDRGLGAPGQARALLADWLCDVHASNCLDEALLVVSEVVTNAAVHAGPPLHLSIDCDSEELHIRLHDGDPTFPRLPGDEPEGRQSSGDPNSGPVDALAERGRGLAIVDLLTSHWHVEQDPLGKTVVLVVPCHKPPAD